MGKTLVWTMGMLAIAPAWAETVTLRNGTRLQGKVVRYGEYLLVSTSGGEARILDEVLVESVSPEPASAMEVFLDLPETPGEVDPDPSKVRFYPSAKAKVRHLLDLATHRGTPPETAERARQALKAMGKPAEEELFSGVVPSADPDRISLILDCLKGAEPKGMEKRLVEVALMAGMEGTCRRAAEEIKRRYGKTPGPVLDVLTDMESSFARARAASDVVRVTRDPEGIAAVVTAIRTRGIKVTKAPRVPFYTGGTQLDPVTGRPKNGGMWVRGKDGELSLGRFTWLDEEIQMKEPEPRLLYHLVAVLQDVSGLHFDSVQEVEDWWMTQPQPVPQDPKKS